MRRTARALSVAVLAGAGLFIAGPSALAAPMAAGGPGTGPPGVPAAASVPCDAPAGPVPDTLDPVSGGFDEGVTPCKDGGGGGNGDDGTPCRAGETCREGAAPQEETGQYDGTAPREGTASHDATVPNEGTGSHEESVPHEGTSSHGATAPHDGTASHDESVPHDGTSSHEATAPHDGTSSDGATAPHDGTSSHDGTAACRDGDACTGGDRECGDSGGASCAGGHTCGEPGKDADCAPATVEHGADAGRGGTFNDSVPALVAGGMLIAAACGGALYRLLGRRRPADG
ncbi:hypothetical protein ACH41H_04440 [Streptomyces sp. NPDC020800]|uniref:hypothetical protein n=1 Tax=Streptomyces sp. NPDC020800 TaxID=3365092 RepID=UPI0037B23CE1